MNYKPGNLDRLRKGMVEDEWKGFLERAVSLGASSKHILDIVNRDLNNE